MEQLFRRPSSTETASSAKDVSDSGGMTPTTEMTEKTQSSESPDSDPREDPLSILYETVVEYRDESGRRLSDIFQKLPSKSVYSMGRKIVAFRNRVFSFRNIRIIIA